MTNKTSKDEDSARLIMDQKSVLGDPWIPVYETAVDFKAQHFELAMANLIKQPNINSTVIMRADILKENIYDPDRGDSTFTSKLILEMPNFPSSSEGDALLTRYLDDVTLRTIPLQNSTIQLQTKCEAIRRMIPRNPFKDHIINQTCLIFTFNTTSVLVVYIPHIKSEDEIPFYLPPVYGVGILYHDSKLSIQYLPFGYDSDESAGPRLRSLEASTRPVRIALRLLKTSEKHSNGQMTGYEKRVYHDLVVPKVNFQNRYISLKKKYSSHLVNNWAESTDPRKHVFEDLAIAAFLIELWNIHYPDASEFEFRDLGCGNGLLVYILISEGYKGIGIDARERKSWKTYPENIQQSLLEQVVVPSVLLKPHPAVRQMNPKITDNGRVFRVGNGNRNHPLKPITYKSADLLHNSKVCTTEDFPKNTFVIGNHSDELTCWIPLLGFPFMVIPCCSHALNGSRARYHPRKVVPKGAPPVALMYGCLVDHVEDIAKQVGWIVEKEMLRIPSTRNAAIIGVNKLLTHKNESTDDADTRVLDIVAAEGGADGWVENCMLLTTLSPRGH